MMGSTTFAEYGLIPRPPSRLPSRAWQRRIVLVTRFEIFDERLSAADYRPQIFCVAGHFVQAQVRVSILANNMRFNEVLAVLAPTCVTARAGVCRRIRHAAPQIILWRKSVLEFVVHKI